MSVGFFSTVRFMGFLEPFVCMLENNAVAKSLLKKRIPTLLGIGVLVIGLIAAIVVFGQGTGVFAPRATPETTPTQIKITNVTDRSFSVSFATSVATTAFIRYGTDPDQLSQQAGDDRDQLYGTVQEYPLHHISASSLEANTRYYFVIGTHEGALFDDNGQPFSVTTATRGGTPPAAKTIYGAVVTAQGGPAKGSIVYVSPQGAGEMSQLVQESGSWAVPLSNARSVDGSSYATLTEETPITILVQGHPVELTSTVPTTVGTFEYGSTITLGEDGTAMAQAGGGPAAPTATPIASASATPTPRDTLLDGDPDESGASESGDATESGSKLTDLLDSELPTPTPTPEEQPVVDLTQPGEQVITSGDPVIQGEAPAGVVVTIKVNSETQIQQQVTSNADGEFSLDLAALQQELEPGVHTVEYSYIDPETGEEVISTHTFTVEPTANYQIAQANTSPTPIPGSGATATSSATPSPTPVSYGTDYPYGTSPTPTPAVATDSGTATDSATKGNVSTRSAMPATDSAVPVSGVFTTTLAMLLGGAFFLISGVWSFWVAREMARVE